MQSLGRGDYHQLGRQGRVNETISDNGVFGDDCMTIIEVVCILGLNPVVSLSAVVCSLINVMGFARMKLRDGVTQNFLVLSVSDTLIAMLTVLINCCLFMRNYVETPLEGSNLLRDLEILLKISMNMPVMISMITTTVIAVVRCSSVTMPLTVRQVITSKRQLATILILSSAAIAVFVYCYEGSVLSASCRTQSLNGTSELVNRVIPGPTPKKLRLWDKFLSVSFYFCLCITLTSTTILIVSLRRATNFRNLASTDSYSSSLSISARETAKREATAIKSVILVSIIFAVFNSPMIALSSWRLIKPSFGCKEHKFVLILCYLFMDLNVCCNIFVYYKFIGRFRQKIDNMRCFVCSW